MDGINLTEQTSAEELIETILAATPEEGSKILKQLKEVPSQDPRFLTVQTTLSNPKIQDTQLLYAKLNL